MVLAFRVLQAGGLALTLMSSLPYSFYEHYTDTASFTTAS